jgi:hypothetical protein
VPITFSRTFPHCAVRITPAFIFTSIIMKKQWSHCLTYIKKIEGLEKNKPQNLSLNTKGERNKQQ